MGLLNARRRAEKLKGEFSVDAAEGGGTLLVWRVPVSPSNAERGAGPPGSCGVLGKVQVRRARRPGGTMAHRRKDKQEAVEISGLPEWPPESHRVVVGVDGSDSSVAALEWAARQAELTGAVLQVVTSWEWPTAVGWAAAPVPDDYQPGEDAERVLQDAIAPVRAAHSGIDIRTTVVEGHPAPVLVEASRGADLLVVGSRGHGQFAGMLLGSVSEHCVGSAHCPVLVLHGDS